MNAQYHSALRALVIFIAVASTSCASQIKAKPVWVDGEVRTGSEQVMFAAVLDGLDKSRYSIGGGVNRSERTVVSNWQLELAPFRGDGYRQKATVRWTRLEKDRFGVNVRVQREANEDIIKPLDVSYAKWKVRPDNDRDAHAILQRIKSIVGDEIEIGEPEKRPSFLDN